MTENSEAERVPLTVNIDESNGSLQQVSPNSNQRTTPNSSSSPSVIVKSTDGKYHRMTFNKSEKQLEFILLKTTGLPTKHKMLVRFEEILCIRSTPVKLKSGLPVCIGKDDINADTPNAIFIYYTIRINVYIWRVREAAVYFSTTTEKKEWDRILQNTMEELEYRPKNLLVYINPYGGKGLAKRIYENQVAPLFQMAGVQARVVLTERANHCYEHVQELDLETWNTIDGIVSVGGDGLFNEVLCSTVIRAQVENNKDISDIDIDSLVTPRMRFGIIGAGSANSIVSTVHGTDDCPSAALHIAIGSNCSVDVATVHEGNKLLKVSANAISYGWLGDVLRDSEHYRFMGPCRYQWSALRTTARHPTYFGRVSFNLSQNQPEQSIKFPECKKPCEICDGTTTDKYAYHWQTDFTHVICCVIPCVSPFTPYCLAPYTGLGDGSMDLAMIPKVSRCANFRILRKVAMYGGKNLIPSERDLKVYRVSRWTFTPGALLLGENSQEDPGKVQQGAWNLDGGNWILYFNSCLEILPQPNDIALHFRLHPRLIKYFGRELDLDDPRYRKCFCCYKTEKKKSNLIINPIE